MRLRVLVATLVLSSTAHAAWDDPRDWQRLRPTAAEAPKVLAPLTLGKVMSLLSTDKTETVTYELLFDGVRVDNLRARVRYRADGKNELLDQPVLPSKPTGSPSVSREAAALVVLSAQTPAFHVSSPRFVYYAERDTKDPNVIAALRPSWRFDVQWGSNPLAPVERQVLVDATLGTILESRDTLHEISSWEIVGRGVHAGEAKVMGMLSEDGTRFCLRAPEVPFDTTVLTACGEIFLFEGAGVSAVTVPPNSLIGRPIGRLVTTAPATLGNGQTALNEHDQNGIESEAVDAFVFTQNAIAFFRLLGTQQVGTGEDGQSVTIFPAVSSVYDGFGTWSEFRDNGRADIARSAIYVGLAKRGLDGNGLAMTSSQLLAHEYTHLVLGRSYGPTTLQDEEFRSLEEAVADVYGVLVGPTMASNGSQGVVAPPTPWMMDLSLRDRFFLNPSADGLSVNAYGDDSGDGTPFDAIEPHSRGGVIRRFFYFLANGFQPWNGFNADVSSAYFPQGMHGIGVKEAAMLLHRAVTEGAQYGVRPNMAAFARGMETDLLEAEGCSPTLMEVERAWAAVNLGSGPDMAAPSIHAQAMQNNTDVIIRMSVRDAGRGLGAGPVAEVLVDGTPRATVSLSFVAQPGGAFDYSGSVTLPRSYFAQNSASSVEVRVTDFCRNLGTHWFQFRVNTSTPYVFELQDFTSVDTSQLANPLKLSSATRMIRWGAFDQLGLTKLTLSIPTTSFTQTVHLNGQFDVTQLTPLTVPASVAEGRQSLVATATNVVTNTDQKSIEFRVDRTPPTCSITCRQQYDSVLASCNVAAADYGWWGTGVFGVKPTFVAPSPVMPPLTNMSARSFNGWLWDFQGTNGHANPPGNLDPAAPSDPRYVLRTSVSEGTSLPPGIYTVELQCRDFWANTSTTQSSFRISTKPSVSFSAVNFVPQANTVDFSLTATVSDIDGVATIEGSWNHDSSSHSISPVTCGSTSCQVVITGSAPAGRLVHVEVRSWDAYATSGVRRTQFQTPVPAPPPTTPNVFNEIEPNNCPGWASYRFTGTFNTVPLAATRVRGHYDYSHPSPPWCGNGFGGDAFFFPFTSGSLSFSLPQAADLNSDCWIVFQGLRIRSCPANPIPELNWDEWNDAYGSPSEPVVGVIVDIYGRDPFGSLPGNGGETYEFNVSRN